MPIEINHNADKFKCELSNIDKVLAQLAKDPDSLNTGMSAKAYMEHFNRED